MGNRRLLMLLCSTSFGLIGASGYALGQPDTSAGTSTTPKGGNAVTDQARTTNPGAPDGKLEQIVVTARRSKEKLQSVPVAVTVLTQKTFSVKGAYSTDDLAKDVPGLSVQQPGGDRETPYFTIRGQGYSFGTIFPAVITYFNEVPTTQFGIGQFFDLSDIQVLRGPQGVLFGRVTDGGNVLVDPKHPTSKPEGYFEAKVGDYNLHGFDGAINVPIVPDKLLVRGAFDVNRRDGYTTNLYNGEKLGSVDYNSFRLGVTFRPVEGLENYTVVQYQHTNDTGSAQVLAGINPAAITNATAGILPLFNSFGNVYGIDKNGDIQPYQPGLTPLTSAAVVASLQSQLARQQALGPRQVFQTTPGYDQQDNIYIANTTSYDLSDNFQIRNIFGYTRVRDDHSASFSGANGFLVNTCESSCRNGADLPFNTQEQFSEEVRLSGKFLNDKLHVSLGTYFDFQHPLGDFETAAYEDVILQHTVVQYSQTYSRAVFGFTEYDASDVLPGLKFNGGLRYTEDQVKSSEATYNRPLESPLAQGELTAFLPYVLAGEGVPFPVGQQLAPGIANATLNSPIPFGKCTNFATGGLFAANCNTYESDFTAVTWTGGVSYQFNPRQLVYAKVSRGYRPGGVNGFAEPGQSPKYAPEYDRSVEVGFKSDWDFGGIPLRTNVAAYHDDYSAIQKLEIIQGATPFASVQNVDDGVVQGVEFEGTLVPFTGMVIGANYSYIDASFDKNVPFDPASCSPLAFVVKGKDFCPYNRFANTPQNQASVSAHYTLPLDERIGTVTVGGRFYYQSSQALTDTSTINPDGIQSSYVTLDLDGTWQNIYGRPVDLTGFITNVTNKLYATGTDDLSQNASLGIRANIYAPPRMFGFGLKYRFGGG